MWKEFWPATFPPLKGSFGAGRLRWLTWPIASVTIVVAPKIWPRRPFCALTVGSPSGARTRSLEDIAEPTDARASDGGLEDRDYDRDMTVRCAVFALPAKYREALILFYFHDMDVTTAARSLGLPEGTVKARLFRGREILRNKLPQLLAVARLKEA